MSKMVGGWHRVEVGLDHVGGGEMYLLEPGSGNGTRNLSGSKRPPFEYYFT